MSLLSLWKNSYRQFYDAYTFLIVLWIENTSFWGFTINYGSFYYDLPGASSVYDSVYYDSQTQRRSVSWVSVNVTPVDIVYYFTNWSGQTERKGVFWCSAPASAGITQTWQTCEQRKDLDFYQFVSDLGFFKIYLCFGPLKFRLSFCTILKMLITFWYKTMST